MNSRRLARAWRRPLSSVFLKILAILLLAAFIINRINTETVFLARYAERSTRATYVRELACGLQKHLGDPPSREAAERLARTGPWRIAYRAAVPGRGWATTPRIPDLDRLRPDLIGRDWGIHDNAFFYIGKHPGGTLVMMTPPRRVELGWKYILLRVGGVAVVMLGVWLAVAWVLAPVRWLDIGVARVAAGDLGHRIPTRENDELGRLAQQFNAMAERVQAMLEQRGRLLLDVSHELRTPLTRMRLGLEALPDDATKAGLAEDLIELEGLVNEILEGARLSHGRSQLQVDAVDFADLVREAAADFMGRPPGLDVEAPPSLVLGGDRVRLQRLLHNLLANAFSHGQPARGRVRLRLESANGKALLTVIDRGPGVPEGQLKNLFTPFFRSDRSRARVSGGVGLGLALCLGVARAHGGDLEARPTPGGGLTFILTLPLT